MLNVKPVYRSYQLVAVDHIKGTAAVVLQIYWPGATSSEQWQRSECLPANADAKIPNGGMTVANAGVKVYCNYNCCSNAADALVLFYFGNGRGLPEAGNEERIFQKFFQVAKPDPQRQFQMR